VSRRFVSEHAGVYPVQRLCELVDVKRSSYYEWVSRPLSDHYLADVELANEIYDIHVASRRTYGAPRVAGQLQNGGRRHGRKRVALRHFDDHVRRVTFDHLGFERDVGIGKRLAPLLAELLEHPLAVDVRGKRWRVHVEPPGGRRHLERVHRDYLCIQRSGVLRAPSERPV
jgi:hypothetical protein